MILEFKNVTGENNPFILKNINFSLPAGYICGLAGKNGAGKSTLMDYILNREQLYRGEILINGENIRQNHSHILNEIGFVSDDNEFIIDRTAEENAKVLGPLYDKWDYEVFRETMKRMNVPVGRKLSAYSRGEYFKFQTAFAYAYHPSLYLLDEATAGMDPVFRIDYFKFLQEIIADESASILMTSHIEDEIARKMDFVGIMEGGRLVEFGESLEVL